jgi:hypothetical protein
MAHPGSYWSSRVRCFVKRFSAPFTGGLDGRRRAKRRRKLPKKTPSLRQFCDLVIIQS